MRYVILAMMFSSVATAAYGGGKTAWVYGGNGDVAGTIMSAGPNNSFIYGRDGELVGSTARAGNTVFIYDENGSVAGSVINSRPSQRVLDME